LQKEIAMTTEVRKAAGKVASWSLVVLVLIGGALISGLADLTGSGILQKAFIFFLGAIIVVQIIPSLMLLGAMFKGIRGLADKKVKVGHRK
jgi:uncharacterized membrane protein required for colicin V production